MTPALDAQAGPDTGEAPLDQESRGPDAHGFEPLACVSCRARKLKCDRTRPACTRCTKVQNDCVYPESRRKPTFKRRNVKELEARLAQVEDYLKEVTHNGDQEGPESGGSNGSNGTFDFNVQNGQAQQGRMADAPINNGSTENPASFANSQLLGMGYSESLPPFEIMEELINIYFSTQHPHMPIVHPSRFWQGFYGGAIRRPPMCLQYIMWASAAQFHPKYDEYSEVFYQRARQYMDVDEMKAKHFITMAHAQAYCLLAQFEAKCMYFTRAAMTSAKCVRLVQMMGFDRLDGEQDDLPPALPPATSWVEMEERRRTFWGAFAIDSHACVSTGWPSLIANADITTRLPASEEAFTSGKEELAPFLDEIFHGATYEGFAGPIVICRIFKGIMHHVHRSKPRDQPEDLLNGAFWKRHRELDNELLSAFMFLPEQFRLPRNIRNPMALHLNLNLHASVICLHHAAVEKAEKFGHTDTIKASIGRLKNAADEIVSIARLTAHNTSIFKNPLSSLSLYCATTVYVYMAKTDIRHGFDAIDKANFETLIQAMEAIARVHQITRAFLQQACLDIERNGLLSVIEAPSLGKYRDSFGMAGSNIPMLARSSVGRHTKVSPVLPGRLPLDKPEGRVRPANLRLSKGNCSVAFADDDDNGGSQVSFNPSLGAVTRNIAIAPTADLNMMYSNKRKRPLEVPGSSGVVDLQGTDMTSFASNGLPNRNTSSNPTTTTGDQLVNNMLGSVGMGSHSMLGNNMALPDRTTPSSSASPLPPQTFSVGRAETQSGSSEESPKATTGLGNTVEENRFDFRPFAGRVATPLWPDLTDDFFHDMVQDALSSQNNGESLNFFGDPNWAGGHLPG
ncbi:binuclear zinc transcription factor [Emericellopsis atlantica]|uniref:Binuclear zinc transcription factor n=1 Tax=Emericellopsis atlantica TaxID=2614577 RepID=A0A9P7ZL19_9HYPO|nr:binuclear zinc transcription factor [Emericellopsis atlantica]KAG9253901.1 binuclear zinc transcription factor [Emericellopsis atlantica]